MVEISQLTQYIESFVDSSRPPSQQAESIQAIASLLKDDILTIELLVREMEMYLTTSDNIIRGKGILLLGEVLNRLASKPLESGTIHSLILFFMERLADWKALRGALVGCLALMRRKINVGMVSSDDAKAVAHSYIGNLQVQSLGQHDRKLCFELLECLLECYPDAAASVGDDLIYGICEAVDGEKDPHCLMITFHIVEVLAKLFPDPSGILSSFAGDLFELLGCYFPIHFTHEKHEDMEVKRDDLSKALMLAVSATPLFEPFAIPLLLEKLSSSLESAKVDSLKYLNECMTKYGAERIRKHAGSIWSSLKDAIFTSMQGFVFPFSSESFNDLGFYNNEVATEALKLLQTVIIRDCSSFSSLVVGDEDINNVFNSINSFMDYHNIPPQSKQKLHAVGCLLHVTSKVSLSSCSEVFQSFFPRLLSSLWIPSGISSGRHAPNHNSFPAESINVGALYLCAELLSAFRDVSASFKGLTSECSSPDEFLFMRQSVSSSLAEALLSTFATATKRDTKDADIYFMVKSLEILATFPGESPVSKAMFDNILRAFILIVTEDFEKTWLWKLTLKALVHIGSFVNQYQGSERALSYMAIVVEKIASLVDLDDLIMPLNPRLEAISDIGSSGLPYMLKLIQALEDSIFSNLSEVYVNGSRQSSQTAALLLDCYSSKIISWINESRGLEEVLLQFTIRICNQIENCKVFGALTPDEVLFDAMMTAMKLAVRSCSKERQELSVQKAYWALLTVSFPPMESLSGSMPLQLEGLHVPQEKEKYSNRDEWIVSLFASVIIAVHPQTKIPNLKAVLHLLMIYLLKGCVLAAQALGSVINKWGQKSDGVEASGECGFEEALDLIFKTKFSHFQNNSVTANTEMGLAELCSGGANNSFIQVNALVGLAWIGKGLLMRGHEKIKDVTMVFLECLLSDKGTTVSDLKRCLAEDRREKGSHPSVIKIAADAFHILMSDSAVCLNREFHAVVRPLHKQRFFSTIFPILESLVRKADPSISRVMLYRALAHVISDTLLVVIMSDAQKVIPMLLDGLSILTEDIEDRDMVYALLLVLSGILMDKNGKVAATENAHFIINSLIGLVAYPYRMVVRETAIQCLAAVSQLPHPRIYPMKKQVLRALSKALDDSKRAVRQEAVKCRQAWLVTPYLHLAEKSSSMVSCS